MPDLLESIEDGIAVLTLNRPERLNALSTDMLRGLADSLQRYAADDAIRCIVLTGAGAGFCAGGDVKAMATRAPQTFEQRADGIRRMHQIPLLMRSMPKVIIGMVNGAAVGAGFGLALACDLRVAARSARFGTGFAKIGLSGDFGGSWLLTRLVGTAKARELYFLGDIIDSTEAQAIGLLNRVVDDTDLRRETMMLARRIADLPPITLGYAKRNLHAAETEPLPVVLEMEAVHQARTAQTEDHCEAIAAFNDKRRAEFRGR